MSGPQTQHKGVVYGDDDYFTYLLTYFRSSGEPLAVQPDTYEEGMLYLEGRRRWLNDAGGGAGGSWDP